MRASTLVLIFCLFAPVLLKKLSHPPETFLHFTDYCKLFSYPVETHKIQTADGYILTFHRIQKKGQESFKSGLPVVFLQHGLTDSSDTFIINYENKAIGFALANKGYDVWIGNSRGNKHSIEHIKWDRKDKEFWNFSFQEMANFDLPAAFQYIASLTKQKISYIGHSQGGMIMLMALSTQIRVVQDNLNTFIGLAPSAYFSDMSAKDLKRALKTKIVEILKKRTDIKIFLANTKASARATVALCKRAGFICRAFLKRNFDANPKTLALDRLNVFIGHAPSGTSLKNILHFKQMIKSGKFQRYDYGSKEENQRHYGADAPPQYLLDMIKAPVHLFVGTTDRLVSVKDSKRVYNELTNATVKSFNPFDIGHLSFTWGKEMPHLNKIFEILEKKTENFE